jgi:hypothetical protein
MLIYIPTAFGTEQQNTLAYELISKIVGPFVASCLLTGTNLLIHYWKLTSKTNIIWGVGAGSKE